MRSSIQFESGEDGEDIKDIGVESRWVFSSNNYKAVIEQISPSPIINQYFPCNQSVRACRWREVRQDDLLMFKFLYTIILLFPN